MGRGAPSSGRSFWTGTLFLPGERSQPGTPEGVHISALRGAEATCAAHHIVDRFDEIRLSDEPALAVGAADSEHRLTDLLGKLGVAGKPVFDLESVDSTYPMIVDADIASPDSFPEHVVIYDNPLPHADNGASTVTELLVTSHDRASDPGGHDPLQAAVRALTTPLAEDADGATLDSFRVSLLDRANKWRP